MKFENTRVFNFENALRGMRNPKESWHLSDSAFGLDHIDVSNIDMEIADEYCKNINIDAENENYYEVLEKYAKWLRDNGVIYKNYELFEYAFIGPKDLKLAQTLIKAGPEHRKFMRQIFVSVDITAPLYFYKELDTYKVGTVANSTSTMHTITNKEISTECFELDDVSEIADIDKKFNPATTINYCNMLREKYLETNDKRYWKELIRWLPESWLQTRTITLNYENLLAMCGKGQRRFHKLNEWSGRDNSTLPNFISWARTLPYAQELIFIDELEKPINE